MRDAGLSAPAPWISALAEEMLEVCRVESQAARRVGLDCDAADLRRALGRLSRHSEMRIRTARIGDAVAVVRLDAAIWGDDGPTMRAKLRPPT